MSANTITSINYEKKNGYLRVSFTVDNTHKFYLDDVGLSYEQFVKLQNNQSVDKVIKPLEVTFSLVQIPEPVLAVQPEPPKA